MVEHIRQNRDKHVRHPQVHFVGQTIQSQRLVKADLLQHITDFTFRDQTLTTSYFGRPKAGDVSQIVAKLLDREVKTAGKAISEMCPKSLAHLADRPQHMPVRGFNELDEPIGVSAQLFLTHKCAASHGFVGNSL